MTDAPNGLTKDLTSQVRKEAIAISAKWLISAAAALVVISVAGWWFYLQPRLQTLLGGMPSKAIVAFDLSADCPPGWDTFNDAAGKFIIGSGQSEGTSARTFRVSGGRETVTLTQLELPNHDHPFIPANVQLYGYGAADKGTLVDGHLAIGATVAYGPPSVISGGHVGTTGEGKSFEIMPPFLPLKYCVKG